MIRLSSSNISSLLLEIGKNLLDNQELKVRYSDCLYYYYHGDQTEFIVDITNSSGQLTQISISRQNISIATALTIAGQLQGAMVPAQADIFVN